MESLSSYICPTPVHSNHPDARFQIREHKSRVEYAFYSALPAILAYLDMPHISTLGKINHNLAAVIHFQKKNYKWIRHSSLILSIYVHQIFLNNPFMTPSRYKETLYIKKAYPLVELPYNHFFHCSSSRKHMRMVEQMPNLQSLMLGCYATSTSTALFSLQQSTSLQSLQIFFPYHVSEPDPISEPSTLLGLQYLTTLKNLNFENCEKITDEYVHCFSGLTQLTILNIQATCITDIGLKHLSSLTILQHLNIKLTPITDIGLQCLSNLMQLRYLDLSFTGATDQGLAFLDYLAMLTHLGFEGCKISEKIKSKLCTRYTIIDKRDLVGYHHKPKIVLRFTRVYQDQNSR